MNDKGLNTRIKELNSPAEQKLPVPSNLCLITHTHLPITSYLYPLTRGRGHWRVPIYPYQVIDTGFTWNPLTFGASGVAHFSPALQVRMFTLHLTYVLTALYLPSTSSGNVEYIWPLLSGCEKIHHSEQIRLNLLKISRHHLPTCHIWWIFLASRMKRSNLLPKWDEIAPVEQMWFYHYLSLNTRKSTIADN